MSDNEKNTGAGKANTGWTDKERLIYLIGLLDHTGGKLDFKNAPRPNGRTEIACERMVGWLKTAYKTELEALKAGQLFDSEATPRAKKTSKTKGDDDGDGTPKTPKRKGTGGEEDGGSPKKKGKKGGMEEVKTEIKEELEYEI